MCDNRDGKFVVPVKPIGRIGLWIGQVIREGKPIHKMNGAEVIPREVAVLWVENPEYTSGTVYSTACELKEFDTVEKAMDFLKSRGACVQ